MQLPGWVVNTVRKNYNDSRIQNPCQRKTEPGCREFTFRTWSSFIPTDLVISMCFLISSYTSLMLWHHNFLAEQLAEVDISALGIITQLNWSFPFNWWHHQLTPAVCKFCPLQVYIDSHWIKVHLQHSCSAEDKHRREGLIVATIYNWQPDAVWEMQMYNYL